MSEHRTPTAILELQRRVEGLPARRKAAEQRATIQKLRGTAIAAAAQQQRAMDSIACTEQTFEAANVNEARSLVARNARTAARLLRDLTEIDAIDKAGVDDAFQDLQTGAAKAVGTIEQEWTRQITAVTTRFQRIVTVAERAELRGSQRLVDTLTRIQAVTKPRRQEAANLKGYLLELGETVQSLGLEGEGGKFLARVADGSANAQDLTRPAVAQFLTEHELWPLLSVRFAQ